LDILLNPSYGKNAFSQFDIFILFLSIYGVLIPFFIRGFVFTAFKGGLLLIKIPLILTLFFSFTWLFIPNYGFLVPERWLLLSGIYISLIAIYGFFLLIDSILKQEKLRKGMAMVFLFIFVVYGFLYIFMPSGVVAFSFPSFFQKNTGFIFPYSMNFNSLKIPDNTDLLKSIDWINSNTSNNSVIIGSKHWRGWFSLFLQPSHQYFFEDFADINDTSLNQTQSRYFTSMLEHKFSYLCKDGNDDKNLNYKNNTLLYFIDLNKGFNTTKYAYPYPPAVFATKSFIVYNLTSQICKG
jgi:hypothetical protein